MYAILYIVVFEVTPKSGVGVDMQCGLPDMRSMADCKATSSLPRDAQHAQVAHGCYGIGTGIW